MIAVKPAIELIDPPAYGELLEKIERIGRVCYKSEDKIREGSAESFIRGIIKRGHESVIEHGSLTVRVTCDRGISHEIVRHRIASYSQESTRYCNYSKDGFGGEITVIWPCFLAKGSTAMQHWVWACRQAEASYFNMLTFGCAPQEARSVLPNSLKTEVVMTANLREWRHFFKLRTAPAAHPQMRELAIPLLRRMQEMVPVVFDDLEVAHEKS